MSCPKIYAFSRSSTNFPNLVLSSPNRKFHARDSSLEITWDLVISYLYASTIAIWVDHLVGDNAATPLLITKVSPLFLILKKK